MVKPRLLPSVTVAFAVVLGVALFNLFGLRPDRGTGTYAISGRAISGSGTLPQDLWVRISWEEGGGIRSVRVPVQDDGSFRAEKLEPGEYRIEAVSDGRRISSEAEPARVAITDRDVTGIEIRL